MYKKTPIIIDTDPWVDDALAIMYSIKAWCNISWITTVFWNANIENTSENALKIIKDFVKKEMEWICSAHDIYHIERVFRISEIIYDSEKNGDKDVVLVSALLHEFLDEKFFSDNLKEQEFKVNNILNTIWFTKVQIEKVNFIIKNIWYWKSLSRTEPISMIEFLIVEDADRLESTGAISIARTFAYWWKKWIPIYDPNIKFDSNLNEKSYWKSSTSINHFYEKLLKIKDLMHTKKWKEIALEKHKFLELFLDNFYKEWNI